MSPKKKMKSMLYFNKLFLLRLKSLTEKYDNEYGNFPENILEGQSVFEYIKDELENDPTLNFKRIAT